MSTSSANVFRGHRFNPVDPIQFTLHVKPRRRMGKPRALKPWQASHVRRAAKLRRELTNPAMARRLGVSKTTIARYIAGQHKD
jgi:hypothetical protein